MKICLGGGIVILDKVQDGGLDWHEASVGIRPMGKRRIRITCPKCKRRIVSSVKTCSDGCCLYHTLPAHKIRYWWRK